MGSFAHKNYKVMIVTLLVIFSFCKKQEPAKIVKQPIKQDSTRTRIHEIMLNNQSDIEANLNALMKLIKEKELEINKALEKLKQKSVELKQKEEQLAKIEVEMRKFRNTSYSILVIGLILIVVSLLLIFKKNSRKSLNELECI